MHFSLYCVDNYFLYLQKFQKNLLLLINPIEYAYFDVHFHKMFATPVLKKLSLN